MSEPVRCADELCRINADGTVVYNWPLIEATAAKWRPFETDWTVCIAKLLLPLEPHAPPPSAQGGRHEDALFGDAGDP
jgi:hypothetical protein